MIISRSTFSAELSVAALLLTTIVFLSPQLWGVLFPGAARQVNVQERPIYPSNANESTGVGFDLTASYG